MKKILLIALALISGICSAPGGALAQTFKVQDINVLGHVQLSGATGSAGNVLQSNGGSAPTWNQLTPGSLAPQSANTVVGNPTGSSAAPQSVPIGNGLSMAGSTLALPSPIVYTLSGISDNTAGLQAAINAALAANVDLKMLGNGAVSGNLTINGPLRWYGAGRDSTFLTCSTTASCITINTTLAVDIHDFLLGSTITSGTTSQILISMSPSTTENKWSKIHNMLITPSGISIETGGSSGTEIYSNVFGASSVTNAIFVDIEANNVPQCNGGEFRVHDNYFIGSLGNNQTGILGQCFGGLYVQHNKFVDVDLPMNFNISGKDPSGALLGSGDLFIQGNSLELFDTVGIQIGCSTCVTGSSFDNILIQGNEVKFPSQAPQFGVIEIIPNASHVKWLTNVQINGNNLGGFTSGTNFMINVQSGLNIDVSHNLLQSYITASTTALFIGADVAGCTLGPNLTLGPGNVPGTGFQPSSIAPTCSPLVAPY